MLDELQLLLQDINWLFEPKEHLLKKKNHIPTHIPYRRVKKALGYWGIYNVIKSLLPTRPTGQWKTQWMELDALSPSFSHFSPRTTGACTRTHTHARKHKPPSWLGV